MENGGKVLHSKFKLPWQLGRFRDTAVEVEAALQLSPICDEGGQLIGSSFWLCFKHNGNAVEGKLHLPVDESAKVILFVPGFPGDGSTRLERLHLAGLLRAGYAVFVIRHNGTIVKGQHSEWYVDCSERQHKAEIDHQELLGGDGAHDISEWLKEPLVALKGLRPVFPNISIVAHSLGAPCALCSLTDLGEENAPELQAVRSFISLAGSTGRPRDLDDPLLQQLRKHLDSDWARERVSIGDSDKNLEILYRGYSKMHAKGAKIPHSVSLTFVIVWGENKENCDEFISPAESLDIISTLGRGSLVIDRTQVADRDKGRLAHDMENLTTTRLLDLLQGTYSEDRRISVIR